VVVPEHSAQSLPAHHFTRRAANFFPGLNHPVAEPLVIAFRVKPVPSNEYAMPPEKRIRGHDAGQLLEPLPAEDFAFDSQPPAPVVAEQDSLLSELLPEDSILSQEVLDGVLLSAVDPAAEDQEQQMPC
jgi:hypothetical protein